MRPLLTFVLGAALACGVVGCGGGLTVRAEIVRPARVPVRAFPRILVTASDSVEAEQVADAVAEHLALGRSDVRRLDSSAVAALRRRGAIPRASVVLHVHVDVLRRDRPEWARREMLSCGPLGCFESRRPYIEDVPVLIGDLTLTVANGRSARPLQREEVVEEDSGLDLLAMRMRVTDRLIARALELVDQRAEQVSIELLPLEDDGVRAALEAIRAGDWTRGRRLLAHAASTERFATRPPAERARLLYDLGQALRFDPSLPAEQRFDEAADALRAAIRLVPEPRYANALAQLEAHRHSREMVRAQEEATAHNFALRDGDPREARGAVPDPPETYR